ncbi:MAG: DNA-protecting protein DprA [Patescibacteria group bacterium]|jgi:DNA processing protein|nr:DNA-protecting protein DprA [Patescibacteria group bacterium]
MNAVKKASWVALAAINGVGTRTILTIDNYLTKHELDWGEFWVLNQDNLHALGLAEKLINRIISFKKEHTIYSYEEWLKTKHIEAVIKGDAEYPPLLGNSEYSPVVMFRKGSPMSWDSQLVVAVVGTRKMTAYGQLVTTKITRELSQLGASIVSGFMYGVDVTAHSSCLEVGGKTMAVLGYGFDYCYPNTQEKLLVDMLQKGASFITPFAPHVTPKKGQFVARNRVVAGMSDAVVVTEAAEKSGSHITASYAADEGKVVCAVPGPITNPYSEGTKSLINQGAVLIQSGREVFEECMHSSKILRQGTESIEPADTHSLINILKTGAFSVEELMTAAELQYTAVISQLIELELSGKVKKEGARWNLIN